MYANIFRRSVRNSKLRLKKIHGRMNPDPVIFNSNVKPVRGIEGLAVKTSIVVWSSKKITPIIEVAIPSNSCLNKAEGYKLISNSSK